jgi:histidine ammonia-lyase
MANKPKFQYGEDHLNAGSALALARRQWKGILTKAANIKIEACQKSVEAIVSRGDPVYGINTGFGPLCTTSITPEETRILQTNILKSHSVGVGSPISKEIATLMLVLKVHSLAKGYSGISKKTIDRILWHIDENIIPVVPSQGSVGASGDLAPLAHLFLPLIGLGEVVYKNEQIPTKVLFDKTGIQAITLGPKEGLALINGTQFIAAHTVKIIEKLHNCLAHADIIGAMMIEGLQGSLKPFLMPLHSLRPYKGNRHVAKRIRSFLEHSEILEDHIDCDRVQDPYSLRCIPQVHGASRTAWLHLKDLLTIELNSITDNPVITGDGEAISGGNFHGQPLALAIDYACIAASEIGNISDRRIYLALEGNTLGVPKLLMNNPGINSGYMMLQYTSAALASENKGLCFPSSADSIPTSLGQEDHVSMGSIGARKAIRVINNVEKILAIELLTAAQAFEYRRPLKSGPILNAIHKLVRKQVAFAKKDRVFSIDINKGIALIRNQSILKLAREIGERENAPIATYYDYEFERY